MGQPSTSNQIRAVALKEAVAATDITIDIAEGGRLNLAQRNELDEEIIQRAEKFAQYIEHGVEVDPNA